MIAVALVVIALVALYLYNIRNFDYWEKRGLKHDKPVLFFGNSAEILLLRKSITEKSVEVYRKYPNEKIVGFFRSTRPELVIRDPEIANRILTTDFINFHLRGLIDDKDRVESILRNLFFIDGDLWKLQRQRMTSAFSSSKLKTMFPLIVERAEHLQKRVLAAAAGSGSLDARDLMARYTTDCIGACGFGIDADSLNNEGSAFRKLGATMFKVEFTRFILTVLKDIMPSLFSHLRPVAHIDKAVKELVGAVLRERNYEPSGRNDFIDLLIESKKKGLITVDSIEHVKPDGTPEISCMEISEDLMAAQVFIFFAAGFETTSSSTSHTLHQLAYYPDVQKKVQEEIDRVLDKHDNKLSYDALNEMTYLNWTFKESLRMFPPIGCLFRRSARKQTIPGTDVTIDKGIRLLVPIQAWHMDPEYFEDPEDFRPERFSPDNFNSTQKAVYIPFGNGPRTCIGERMAVMQALAGLAAVLAQVSVAPAPETLRRPIIDPKLNMVQLVKDGLPLLFKPRK